MKSIVPHEGSGCARPPRPHPARCTRGFTLVEIIAVIAIIALISGVLIGSLLSAHRKAGQAATDALLKRISLAIEAYHHDYAAYPPDGEPEHGWNHWVFEGAYGNGVSHINTPAETVWFFLSGMFEATEDAAREVPLFDETTSEGRDKLRRLVSKSPYMQFREQDLRRTGKRFLMGSSMVNQDDDDLPGDKFMEVVDPWGTPIYYAAKDDLVLDEDHPNGPQDARDTRDPIGNIETFDLVSRGPDRQVYHVTADPDEWEDSYVNREGGGKRSPNRDNVMNFPFRKE